MNGVPWGQNGGLYTRSPLSKCCSLSSLFPLTPWLNLLITNKQRVSMRWARRNPTVVISECYSSPGNSFNPTLITIYLLMFRYNDQRSETMITGIVSNSYHIISIQVGVGKYFSSEPRYSWLTINHCNALC
jgi:hypothetical protein